MIKQMLILIVLSITLLFVWLRFKFTYWRRKNIPIPPVSLFLKLLKMGISQQNSFAERDLILYRYFRSKKSLHGGTYFYHLPMYIPIDLNIIKHILQIDHQYFTDRGLYVNEKGDPLSAHLFSLGGDKWRALRKKLTPTFTSGKMKMLFQTIQDCTEDLRKVLDDNKHSEVDIKDVMGKSIQIRTPNTKYKFSYCIHLLFIIVKTMFFILLSELLSECISCKYPIRFGLTMSGYLYFTCTLKCVQILTEEKCFTMVWQKLNI